ncbi:MAG: alpha/beta fold hydrolase [Chloroflexota bacterium]|nr:alpha/beta fold hydrolase [Chloroflexota bacterium]
MEPKIQYARTADGVSIAYWTMGEGLPFLELQLPFSNIEREAREWEWHRLVARDRMVIRYDNRGAGSSQRDVGDFSLAALLMDVEAVVERLGFERVALYGEIFSAPVAIAYAALHPERVSHLILVGAFADPAAMYDVPRMKTLLSMLDHGDWEAYTDALALYGFGWDQPSAARDMSAFYQTCMKREQCAAFMTAAAQHDVTALLPQVRAPTLVVHPTSSTIPPVESARAVAAGISGSKYSVIESPSPWSDELTEGLLIAFDEFLGDGDRATLAERLQKPAIATRGSLVTRSGQASASALQPAPAAKTFAAGRYVVVRPLGAGGQKSVYLVHDNALDRDCALALIRNEDLGPDDLLRFQHEAQAMARLGAHSNIVSVFDIGEQDSRPFLVSEYIAGGDLRQLLLKRGRLPFAEALAVGSDIARALAVAHARGVVHRDVKPLNVWLTEDGAAKLGDFGLAFSIDRTRMTIAGTVMGTATYMAPEQARGEPADARTDLYALGVMLYEMVCGRPPFSGDDPLSVISQHAIMVPVAPVLHVASLPPALNDLILRLLAKAPDERPANAAVVLEELRAIAERLRTPEQPVEPGAEEPENPLAAPGFAGRTPELEQLAAALDRTAGGAEPAIQYTKAVDGVGIAWWEAGDGYPLIDVHTPPFSNIRLDWQNIPFHQRLAERFRLIRFDTRGSGLSQRDAADVSVDAMVADMEAVVAAAKIERFAIFSDTGASPVTIAYAIKYPNRVSHLVLWNPILDVREFLDTPRMKALDSMMEQDWELYTEGLASTMMGWESADETRGFARLLRDSVEPDMARKVFESLGRYDITPLFGSVSVPTLVLHPSSSELPSLRASQLIAASIPGARLRTGTADNPWSHEVETSTVDAVWGFVGMGRPPAR